LALRRDERAAENPSSLRCPACNLDKTTVALSKKKWQKHTTAGIR
jgi:hypothetical protein